MSWYIRKSSNIGPLRFNFSKSGIGTSFGFTGFRIGIKPNGQSYLHAGRHGLYYRQNLTTNRTQPSDISTDNTVCYNTIKTTDYYGYCNCQITKSYKSFRFDYLTIAISIIVLLSIILFIPHNFLGGDKTLYYILVCSIVLIGIISYLLVLKWEQKSDL